MSLPTAPAPASTTPRTTPGRAAALAFCVVFAASCRPRGAAPAGPAEPPLPAPSASASISSATIAPTTSAVASAPGAPAGAAPSSAPGAGVSMGNHRGDGCWGTTLPADHPARLAALGERCTRGLAPLVPASRLDAPQGTAELPLPPLAPGACLRAAAVAQGGVELTLVGDDGAPTASDASDDFALLTPAGPLCPRRREGLRLALRRRAGPGPAWVQVWSSAR